MNKSLIVNLHGGLGNQLFHYSFAKILSAKLNRKILLDASDYKQKIGNGVRNFELNYFYTKIDFIHTKSNLYNELGTLVLNLYINQLYNNFFYKRKNELLYFNPTKSKILFAPDIYFKDIDEMTNNILNVRYILKERFWNYTDLYPYKNDILQDIVLDSIKLDEKNNSILSYIKSEKDSVAIHIRRGDFLTRDYPINLSNSKYYHNAIEFIKSKLKNPKFFIFSDDKEFIKSYFSKKKNCKIVDINDDSQVIFDFYLMRQCKHFIMANSTLSWWVAFCNTFEDSIVLTPKLWLNKQAELKESYAPKKWIRISINE